MKLFKPKWKKLASAESIEGYWDFINMKQGMKLVKFDGNSHFQEEIYMTEEEWEDLIKLIKRIS